MAEGNVRPPSRRRPTPLHPASLKRAPNYLDGSSPCPCPVALCPAADGKPTGSRKPNGVKKGHTEPSDLSIKDPPTNPFAPGPPCPERCCGAAISPLPPRAPVEAQMCCRFPPSLSRRNYNVHGWRMAQIDVAAAASRTQPHVQWRAHDSSHNVLNLPRSAYGAFAPPMPRLGVQALEEVNECEEQKCHGATDGDCVPGQRSYSMPV